MNARARLALIHGGGASAGTVELDRPAHRDRQSVNPADNFVDDASVAGRGGSSEAGKLDEIPLIISMTQGPTPNAALAAFFRSYAVDQGRGSTLGQIPPIAAFPSGLMPEDRNTALRDALERLVAAAERVQRATDGAGQQRALIQDDPSRPSVAPQSGMDWTSGSPGPEQSATHGSPAPEAETPSNGSSAAAPLYPHNSVVTMTREELQAHLAAQSAQSEARLAHHQGAMEAALAKQNGEIEARLGAFGARIDLSIEELRRGHDRLDKSIDDLRTEVKAENKTTRLTVVVTAISTAATVIFGVGAINSSILSNMVASFESGKNTAATIAQSAEQLRQAQELAAKTADLLKRRIEEQVPTPGPQPSR